MERTQGYRNLNLRFISIAASQIDDETIKWDCVPIGEHVCLDIGGYSLTGTKDPICRMFSRDDGGGDIILDNDMQVRKVIG